MEKPKKSAMGRGLGQILASNTTAPLQEIQEKIGVGEIPLSQIEINPFQPRQEFDPAALEELAASIKAQGIIQPLTVRKMGEGQYQLIAGERRLRASKIAGLTLVPAYVRTANDEQMLEMALIENIQRQDLNPVEIALSYQRMISELNLKQEELGEKVGKDRATVANYLRLLKLPPEILKALRDNTVSMGHGRALIALDSSEKQLELFHEVVDKGLSVRQTEELKRRFDKPVPPKAPSTPPTRNQIHLEEVRKKLEEKFGSKVRMTQDGTGSGDFQVSFHSNEDLNRILEILDLI